MSILPDYYDAQVIKTGLTAVGTPAIATTDRAVLIAYCTGDAQNHIALDQANITPQGPEPFQVVVTNLANFNSSNAGIQDRVSAPCLALMPDQQSGYLGFVNAAQQIEIHALAVVGGNWVLTNLVAIYSASQANSGPTMRVGQQNGQLVLNIVWMDGKLNSLALAQLELQNPQPLLTFRALGEQSMGAPCLARAGGVGFIAWTGTNGWLNLAMDLAGGVSFDFDAKLSFEQYTSAYGCAFVPFGARVGYMLWASQGGGERLAFQQVAVNANGEWVLNPDPACSGQLANAMPPGSGIFAHADLVRDDETGLYGPAVSLAFTSWGNPSQVVLASFPADLSPVPIVQYVTA